MHPELHPLDSRVIDEVGNPTPALLELLDELGLRVKCDNTLADIVSLTQAAFFQKRPDGQARKRWELVNSLDPDLLKPGAVSDLNLQSTAARGKCLELLRQLSMLDEIPPCWGSYDYGGVLGALVTAVRIRLNHLAHLWSHGCPDMGHDNVRFSHIVFFGGERPLHPEKESMSVFLNQDNGILPFRPDWNFSGDELKTELDMMKLVWDQALIPAKMRDLPVTWVNAPMKPNPHGQDPLSPNTEDTFSTWLKTANLVRGDAILLVSHQPYVCAQDAAARMILADRLCVETVGPATSLDAKLILYLRELAGRLRRIHIMRTGSNSG